MDLLRPANIDQLKSFLMMLTIVQARLLPLFLLIPFLSRSMIPRVITVSIATGLGLLVVPALPSKQLTDMDMTFLMLLGKEAILGMVLGYVIAIPFWIMEAIGFVVDNQRGASMAATINPMTGHDTSPLGILFNFAFITYFMVSDGLTMMLGVMYDSYRLWPPLSFWPSWNMDAADLLMTQMNHLLLTALLLAAPVLLAMFLSELGLALVSRFAPQLQVFFLAMPIKSALGMFVLIVYAGTLFNYSHDLLQTLPEWPTRLDRVFNPKY